MFFLLLKCVCVYVSTATELYSQISLWFVKASENSFFFFFRQLKDVCLCLCVSMCVCVCVVCASLLALCVSLIWARVKLWMLRNQASAEVILCFWPISPISYKPTHTHTHMQTPLPELVLCFSTFSLYLWSSDILVLNLILTLCINAPLSVVYSKPNPTAVASLQSSLFTPSFSFFSDDFLKILHK